MTLAPIVITGCPRSGTQMMARVFGNLSENFCLITEHSNKKVDVPEENLDVEDHQLWWDHFEYTKWNEVKKCPRIDIPIPNEVGIRKIRDSYLQLAQGRRIVIKNPSHILYPHIIRQVFPNAKFVFCIRNPWHTLQSMIKHGHPRLLLLSPRAANEQKSLLLRAAIGWSDAFTSYHKERDKDWVVAQYENITDSPQTAIAGLCKNLEIHPQDDLNIDQAAAIPQTSRSNFYYIKNAFQDSPDQNQITEEIRAGCSEFDYPLTPEGLQGTCVTYAFEEFATKLRKKTALKTWRRSA